MRNLRVTQQGLFREPRGTRGAWIQFLVGATGVGFFIYVFFFLPIESLEKWGAFSLVGPATVTVIFLLAVAEVLPSSWRRLAGLVRMVAFATVFLGVFFVYLLGSPFGRPSLLMTVSIGIWAIVLGIYDLLPDKRARPANLVAAISSIAMVTAWLAAVFHF